MNRTLLWTPVTQDNLPQGLSVKHTHKTTSRTEHFPPRFLPHSLMLLKCLPHYFFWPNRKWGDTIYSPSKFLIIIYILHTPKEKPWIPVRSTVLLWGLWVYGHTKVNFGSKFFLFFFKSVQPQIAFSTSRSVPLSLWHVSPLNINLQ